MTKAPTPTFPSPTAPVASRAEVHLRYLDYFRAVLVAKLEGLSEAELGSRNGPSSGVHHDRRFPAWLGTSARRRDRSAALTDAARGLGPD
jgi:hypothetical protein